MRLALAAFLLQMFNARFSIAPAQPISAITRPPRAQPEALPCVPPEIILYTNASAFIPGIGMTNFPASTTFGLQEIVDLCRWQSNSFLATQPMAGGTKIRLAPGDYPFSSEINLGDNNLTIEGAGPFQTVIKWVGTTNHSHLIYETGTSSNGEYLALRDLSVVVPMNFPAVVLDLSNALMDIKDIGVIGPNMQNRAPFIYWPGYVAPNTSPPSLVGLKIGTIGGNWHYVRDSFFVGNAVAIYIPDCNWNLIDGCMFIATSELESSDRRVRSFTNTYPMGDPLHCGAAVISQNVYGMTRVANCQFTTCNACVANFAAGDVVVSDNRGESLGHAFYEDDGQHPITFEQPVPDLADPDASELFLEQLDSNYNIIHPGLPASHAAYSGLHYVTIYNDGKLPGRMVFASAAAVGLIAFLTMNRKLKNKSQELEIRTKQLEARAAGVKLQLDKLEQIANKKGSDGG